MTLVLPGPAGAGGITPPASTMIAARLNHVQEHSSRVSVLQAGGTFSQLSTVELLAVDHAD